MRNEPMRRNDLPETCLSILPSTGQLIIIQHGERGYYPSEWDTGKREENREIASSHNVRRGITDIQEAAMLAGSMFGWNTPGANPQWYLDNARYVNSNIVQGHIKDPIMSVYYPVSSFLLRYEIMGTDAGWKENCLLRRYHRFQGGPGVFGTTESAKETQRTR